jgi:hypothetical protein
VPSMSKLMSFANFGSSVCSTLSRHAGLDPASSDF